LEARSGPQIVQPTPDKLRPLRAMSTAETLAVVPVCRLLAMSKDYFHRLEPPHVMLTERVN
jgi:hypothetical protein